MRALRAVLFALVFALGVAGFLARGPDVFVEGGVYFLDPDCYSRMTRVALLMGGRGLSIRSHDFENAPEGVTPHTTAPMDWLIAAPAALLDRAGVRGAREMAGAWISPALGAVFLAAMGSWLWGRTAGLPAFLLSAVSPILAHTFSIGRPDHQSLVVCLVGIALMLEVDLWEGRRWRPVLAGCLWGAACWVSLFEPLLLLAVCLGLRSFVLGGGALPTERRSLAGLAAFIGWLLVALAVDGWRGAGLSPAVREFFPRWAATIGELRPAELAGLVSWLGWLVPLLPVALIAAKWRNRASIATALLALLGMATAWGMARWGPFAVVACALAMPAGLSLVKPRWLAAILFVVSMLPVSSAWDRQLFPEGEVLRAREEERVEGVLLRRIASGIQPEGGTVVAPWWLSPAIAYWTRARCVAGSSHQSLAGIVRTARFFMETQPDKAGAMLSECGAGWVLADDPARVIETSQALIGRVDGDDVMARRLYGGQAPAFLSPTDANAFFRLYRVGPKALPDAKGDH